MNNNLIDIEDLSVVTELYCKNKGITVKNPIDFGIVNNGLGTLTIQNWSVQGVEAPTKKDLEDLVKNNKESINKLKKNKNIPRVIIPIVDSVDEIDNPQEGQIVLENTVIKVYKNKNWI